MKYKVGDIAMCLNINNPIVEYIPCIIISNTTLHKYYYVKTFTKHGNFYLTEKEIKPYINNKELLENCME